MALNVADLPDPVAPAIATTVWSPEIAIRSPARLTTADAASTTSSGERPRLRSAASPRARIRAARGTWLAIGALHPDAVEIVGVQDRSLDGLQRRRGESARRLGRRHHDAAPAQPGSVVRRVRFGGLWP